MSRLLSRLVSESAVYGLGAAASQIVGIILVPIYARELGAASYGMLAVLNTTISLSSMLAGLALAQAFFRTYLKDATTAAERRHVLSTSVTLRLMLSGIAALVITVASTPLAIALFDDAMASGLLVLVAGIVLLDTITVIPLSYLRAERRPLAYAGVALTRAALGSVLIVLFVVVADMGVRGALVGSLLAAAATSLVGMVILLRGGVRLAWDGPLVLGMLSFSLPLVPAAAASWILSFVDRFFLQTIEGSQVVGIYAAGYTVGLAVSVFAVQPFTLMWAAAKWDIYRDEQRAPEIFARVTTAFTIVSSFAALGVAALATDIIRLLLTPEFDPARQVVPFSAFATVLYGVYTLTGTGLNVEAKTKWIAAIFLAAAALNVGLNIVLIPAFGFMGAAYATIAGYSFLAVATAVASQRYYPIPWELPKLLGTLGIGFALAVAAYVGPDHLVWRVACFGVYGPVLLILGILRPADLRSVLSSIRRQP